MKLSELANYNSNSLKSYDDVDFTSSVDSEFERLRDDKTQHYRDKTEKLKSNFEKVKDLDEYERPGTYHTQREMSFRYEYLNDLNNRVINPKQNREIIIDHTNLHFLEYSYNSINKKIDKYSDRSDDLLKKNEGLIADIKKNKNRDNSSIQAKIEKNEFERNIRIKQKEHNIKIFNLAINDHDKINKTLKTLIDKENNVTNGVA